MSLSPIAVNVLMAAQPVVIGLCAAAAQKLSKYIGTAMHTYSLERTGLLAPSSEFLTESMNSPLQIQSSLVLVAKLISL